jgi:hypothetical protein
VKFAKVLVEIQAAQEERKWRPQVIGFFELHLLRAIFFGAVVIEELAV